MTSEEYIAKLANEEGPLKNFYAELLDLYRRKLWHQITLKLLELTKKLPDGAPDNLIVSLYENVIRDNLEYRISPLAHVEIAYTVVGKYSSVPLALEFMETVKNKVSQDPKAALLASIIIARIYLVAKNMEEVERRINELEPLVNELPPTPSIHGRFYDVASSYYQYKGDHSMYYKTALSFIACSPSLSMDQFTETCFNIALAALLSDSIFNMGEILQHSNISSALANSKHAWVLKMLEAVGRGDVDTFNSLKEFWSLQPDLLSGEQEIRKKIALLSLVEIAFQDRSEPISFNTIAAHSKLPIDEIEHLIMRAMSLNLIKGSIDQVSKVVTIDWVRPRTLTKSQIEALKCRLDKWVDAVDSLSELILAPVMGIST